MRKLSLAFLALCFLPACSGGTGFGGGRSADAESDGEEEPADIPAEVSGSFLTMDCAILGDVKPSDPSQKVGCAAFDENRQRYPGDHRFELSLRENEKIIPLNTFKSDDPEWDVKADVPTRYLQSKTAVFRMDVAFGTDLVASPSFLVRDLFGSDLHSAASSGSSLTGFTTHTAFQFPAASSFIVKGMKGPNGNDFCDANGAVIHEIPEPDKISDDDDDSGFPSDLLSSKAYPVAKIQQFSPETYACFMKFEFNGDSDEKYVFSLPTIGAPRCLVIALSGQGNLEYLTIDLVNGEAADGAVTAENLDAFIKANNSCGG